MRFLCMLFVFLFLMGCETTHENREPTPVPQRAQREITSTEIKPRLLGEWQTQIINQDEARVNNITLAVAAIHGITLKPEEAFSFNQTLGERTEEKGYQKADIFVGDKTEKAFGGGICQVSGTLFMAVKQAGLSVTERHAHSRAVAYAAEGEDACVNYGSMDFCFVNTTQNTIEILAATDGTSVTVQIVESK